MMAAHGIPVSAQMMIIRLQKDRFIIEIVPNVPPETRRWPPVAAATGLPDICQISPALLLLPPLFHILKNCYCCCCCSSSSSGMGQHHAEAPWSSTMQQHLAAAPCSSTLQQHHAATPCSSTMQQHHAAAGPSSFYYTYICLLAFLNSSLN